MTRPTPNGSVRRDGVVVTTTGHVRVLMTAGRLLSDAKILK